MKYNWKIHILVTIGLTALVIFCIWGADKALGADFTFDNFESYTAGDLGGQGNWVTWPNENSCQIETSNVYEGSKAVFCDTFSGGKYHKNKLTDDLYFDKFSFYLKAGETNASHVLNIDRQDLGQTISSFQLFSNGNVRTSYYDPATGNQYLTIAPYSANVWYKVDLEFNNAGTEIGGAQYGLYRARFNNGTWTDWLTTYTFTHIGRISIGGLTSTTWYDFMTNDFNDEFYAETGANIVYPVNNSTSTINFAQWQGYYSFVSENSNGIGIRYGYATSTMDKFDYGDVGRGGTFNITRDTETNGTFDTGTWIYAEPVLYQNNEPFLYGPYIKFQIPLGTDTSTLIFNEPITEWVDTNLLCDPITDFWGVFDMGNLLCHAGQFIKSIPDTFKDVVTAGFSKLAELSKNTFPISGFYHINEAINDATATTSLPEMTFHGSANVFKGNTYTFISSTTIPYIEAKSSFDIRDFFDKIMYGGTALTILALTILGIKIILPPKE